MELKILFSVFFTVFLAELGDKTQLTALALGASNPKAWFYVFLGSSLALILTSFIASYGGQYLSRYIDLKYIRLVSGIVFVILGAFYIYSFYKNN
jgi:putative Ca2+/H+ antiporter (TMEM165/GDT1 family)